MMLKQQNENQRVKNFVSELYYYYCYYYYGNRSNCKNCEMLYECCMLIASFPLSYIGSTLVSVE